MATVTKIKDKVSSDTEEFCKTIYLPDRDARIDELTCYKTENKSFEPIHKLEDWLEVEWEFML